jgi:hypothetical protein
MACFSLYFKGDVSGSRPVRLLVFGRFFGLGAYGLFVQPGEKLLF